MISSGDKVRSIYCEGYNSTFGNTYEVLWVEGYDVFFFGDDGSLDLLYEGEYQIEDRAQSNIGHNR